MSNMGIAGIQYNSVGTFGAHICDFGIVALSFYGAMISGFLGCTVVIRIDSFISNESSNRVVQIISKILSLVAGILTSAGFYILTHPSMPIKAAFISSGIAFGIMAGILLSLVGITSLFMKSLNL